METYRTTNKVDLRVTHTSDARVLKGSKMSGRGGWTTVGMPSNGTVFYQLITPVNVGAEPDLDDAHRAVSFGVRQIQRRVNDLHAPPVVPSAFITSAELNFLSAAHRSQWEPYTTAGGAHGYAPRVGVVPFLTGAELAKLSPTNQLRFSPFMSPGGARGYEPTSLMVPNIVVNGVFDERTSNWVKWAQRVLGLKVDGRVGQSTSLALFWPYISALPYTTEIRHAIGGICSHESHFDPGAVGYETPDDIGLMQINIGATRPPMSEADRFNFHIAYAYAGDRLTNALAHYGNLTYAIASYYVPAWADEWAATGTPPNTAVSDFVQYVKTWSPSSAT